jgi:hypothetical protein
MVEPIYTRVIKYKAFHRTEKKMYDVTRIDFHPGGKFAIRTAQQPNTTFVSKDVELLQYTNLLDKNRIEIYEGWIIRDPETGRCYEVLFRADRFMIERKLTDPKNPGYELSDLYPTNEELEVAGNIFEHPDLLAKVGYPSLYEDKPTH